jgi:hypothetical protein
VSNVIFIEFYNKKNFPPGKWLREPDLCSWDQYDLPCLAIRDMSIGIWKGFVGLSEEHLFYNKGIDELLKSHELLEFFFSIHGGVCNAGRLPLKYKDHAKNFWWVGMETSHGNDLMPLLKLDLAEADMSRIQTNQTYKDLLFIRKETNKLAKYLSKVKANGISD